MEKTKFYHFKYSGRKIILGYCNYSFDWYTIKKNGAIIIFINNNLDNKLKSKILHKAIRKAYT
ncbi:hypothetical protein [Clostridium guangxiense]|uniref:hypothetical protein n=1 Tax=Clostridium guangxiense TaxID=1662055 RepID=UPI001E5E7ABD|nr:hypothetical protein [Clostridium guangxiense]MCD2345831.1 hypothetical protein [Clostridium guangxiense]